MEKINFVNNQEPAINDTNLNQMQTNIENDINTRAKITSIAWKENAVIDSTNNTITIPIAWNDLQEIALRVLGTDNGSFGYLTIPRQLWHNNGAYELQVNCFDYNGNFKGYKQFKVTTKNTNNFVITMSGTAGGVMVVYR